jgi:hypothetical protein
MLITSPSLSTNKTPTYLVYGGGCVAAWNRLHRELVSGEGMRLLLLRTLRAILRMWRLRLSLLPTAALSRSTVALPACPTEATATAYPAPAARTRATERKTEDSVPNLSPSRARVYTPPHPAGPSCGVGLRTETGSPPTSRRPAMS